MKQVPQNTEKYEKITQKYKKSPTQRNKNINKEQRPRKVRSKTVLERHLGAQKAHGPH